MLFIWLVRFKYDQYENIEKEIYYESYCTEQSDRESDKGS